MKLLRREDFLDVFASCDFGADGVEDGVQVGADGAEGLDALEGLRGGYGGGGSVVVWWVCLVGVVHCGWFLLSLGEGGGKWEGHGDVGLYRLFGEYVGCCLVEVRRERAGGGVVG